MEGLTAVFGGGKADSSDALRQQNEATRQRLEKESKREDAKRAAKQRLIEALQGRGGQKTLFNLTGESGVPRKLSGAN